MRTAAFERSYTAIGMLEDWNAEVELMLTMLPWPRGAIARSAACITKKTPRTLTAITRSNSSGVVSDDRAAEAEAGVAHDGRQRRQARRPPRSPA